MSQPSLLNLETYDAETGDAHIIIETPQGSRSKFAYEADKGVFVLKKVMPVGSVFPYDFGFLPATQGEDGDPLDVLILLDAPLFQGNLVPSRLIGVIEAEQTERDGRVDRNDRLIAVASCSQNHQDTRELSDLPESLMTEIEHFFVSYNQLAGKTFKPLHRGNSEQAKRLVEEGRKLFQTEQK